MNLTFKTPLLKSWTLLDDKIIRGNKDIMLSEIEKVVFFNKGGKFTNGVITVHIKNNSMKPFNLTYPPKLLDDGLKAFEYLDEKCNKEFRSSEKSISDIEKEISQLPDVYSFGTRKEIKELPYLLEANENIKAMTSGMTDGTTWLIVCTNKRVLMLDKGLVYGLKLIDIPLDRINSITHSKGLVMGTVSITDGATTRRIENIANTTVSLFASTVNKEVEVYKQSKNTPIKADTQAISGAEEIMKYKELLDLGILTAEEFEIKKKEILNL